MRREFDSRKGLWAKLRRGRRRRPAWVLAALGSLLYAHAALPSPVSNTCDAVQRWQRVLELPSYDSRLPSLQVSWSDPRWFRNLEVHEGIAYYRTLEGLEARDAETGTVLWQRDGFHQFVFADTGMVALGSRHPGAAGREVPGTRLALLDPHDGSERHQTTFDIGCRSMRIESDTPLVVKVWGAAGCDGEVEELWHLDAATGGILARRHGESLGTVRRVDGILLQFVEGHLKRLSPSDLSVLWTNSEQSFSTFATWRVVDGRLVTEGSKRQLLWLDLDSGRRLHEVSHEGETSGAAFWIVDDEFVGVVRDDGTYRLLRLDLESGRTLWEARLDFLPKQALDDGSQVHAFGGGGHYAVLDASSGVVSLQAWGFGRDYPSAQVSPTCHLASRSLAICRASRNHGGHSLVGVSLGQTAPPVLEARSAVEHLERLRTLQIDGVLDHDAWVESVHRISDFVVDQIAPRGLTGSTKENALLDVEALWNRCLLPKYVAWKAASRLSEVTIESEAPFSFPEVERTHPWMTRTFAANIFVEADGRAQRDSRDPLGSLESAILDLLEGSRFIAPEGTDLRLVRFYALIQPGTDEVQIMACNAWDRSTACHRFAQARTCADPSGDTLVWMSYGPESCRLDGWTKVVPHGES